jgi:TPR repeat protein
MFKKLINTAIILVSISKITGIALLVNAAPIRFVDAAISISDRFHDVPHQDPKYPLKTKIGIDSVKQLQQFFVFLKVEKSKIIALRPLLQPLADAGDPLALYWLAKTYDLAEFGLGDEQDFPTALKYYLKAADRNLATAEYFLSQVYRYQFMGVAKDERQAISYLERAKLHGDKELKSEVMLEYARLHSPTSNRDDFTFIPRDRNKMIAALRSAYILNPKSATAADWWGQVLYEDKRYSEALKVYRHSANPTHYGIIGKMHETGQGTRANVRSALIWYKKAAKSELSPDKFDNRFGGYSYHHSSGVANIYRLVCQRKISPSDAIPFFEKQGYQHYLQSSLNHQKFAKLRSNPCIPLAGG